MRQTSRRRSVCCPYHRYLHQALPSSSNFQLSSRHPGTKTPPESGGILLQSSAAIPSSFRGGDLVSRTALLRLSQKASLSYQLVPFNLYISGPDHQHKLRHTLTRTPTRQCLSAHAPRPSSGAPGTSTTTPFPRPTPQTPTSDGPAMYTNLASPCRDPNIGHHQRKSTRSISTLSALPMLGAARASKASTRLWALARLADFLAQHRAGGAVGTAGQRA